MALREKLDRLRKVLTVEPVIIIYAITHHNFYRLSLHLTDRYLSFDGNSNINSSYGVLVKVASLVSMSLVLGSFSDRLGLRKPFLLFPFCGELVKTVAVFVCSRREKLCSYNAFNLIRDLSMPSEGMLLLVLMSFAYVSDVTDKERRTCRLAFVQLLLMIFTHGSYTIGFLWPRGEPNLNLWIVGQFALILGGLLYGIFWLPALARPEKKAFLDLFNPRHFLFTVKTLWVKRPERNLFWILFGLIFAIGPVVIIRVASAPELLTFRDGGHYWLALSVLVFLVMVLLVKLWRLSDLVVLAVGLTGLGIDTVLSGFVYSEPALRIGQVLNPASLGLTVAVSVSLLTKAVSKEEHGKIVGLYCLCYILLSLFLYLVEFWRIRLFNSVMNWILVAVCAASVTVTLWLRANIGRFRKEEVPPADNGEDDCRTTSAV